MYKLRMQFLSQYFPVFLDKIKSKTTHAATKKK